MKKGWAKTLNLKSYQRTRKYHYFRGGLSLCGKYRLFNTSDLGNYTGSFSEDNCKKCLELWGRDN
ncbi:hypothetical protein LCGC14_2364660, partial [marine sediment metagenome]